MIGILIISIALLAFVAIISYKEGRLRAEHLAKEQTKVLTDEAYIRGYKQGEAKGQAQGYEDGCRYTEIRIHNEQVLKKEGVIK